METPTHKIEVPAEAIINPKNHLLKISSQAFFRRLTSQERAALRGSATQVRDLKEDLDRANLIELDDVLRTLLTDSGLFTPERIEELMIKGEGHEGRLR
jgi:hypothetical protein